jgi:uncharacterized membrane protein YfhO
MAGNLVDILSTVSAALMTPLGSLAWSYLPAIRFVQHSWRWLFVLSLALSILGVDATSRFPGKIAWRLLACALLSICLASIIRRSNFSDPVAKLQVEVAERNGYRGYSEYAPIGIKGAGRDMDVREIHIQKWAAESRIFSVDAPYPGNLTLPLRNYRAWRAEVNGRAVEIRSDGDSGQAVIHMPEGHSEVRLDFTRTPDRTLGGALSVATAVLVLAVLSRRRQVPNHALHS